MLKLKDLKPGDKVVLKETTVIGKAVIAGGSVGVVNAIEEGVEYPVYVTFPDDAFIGPIIQAKDQSPETYLGHGAEPDGHPFLPEELELASDGEASAYC